MTEDFSIYNGEGTELRKAQLRMLDMLEEIDRVCRAHDIPYWLDFGTLLGAVRHQGFIPWDDDADISVFKSDNERLVRYLTEELPDYYIVVTPDTDDNFNGTGFIRVVDIRSNVVRLHQGENYEADESDGVCIDIFNVEKGRKGIKNLLAPVHGRADRRVHKVISDGRLNYVAACFIYPFTSFVIFVYRLVYRIFPSDMYIYNIPNFVVRQMFSQRRRSDILPVRPLLFEGVELMCPSNPDAFLRETYGDYMQIPPVEKRVVHTKNISVKE